MPQRPESRHKQMIDWTRNVSDVKSTWHQSRISRSASAGFAILLFLLSNGNRQTHMKYFIALLIVTLIAFGLMFFNSDRQHSNEDRPHSNDPVTGLPWQVDTLPDGSTQVFGIKTGKTTLAGVMEQLGEELGLAIIAAPHETGSLEAYYSHYSAGPITGKLILVLDVAPDVLSALRQRAFQDGGTRRYHLHPDDLPVAYRAPVKAINFLPSFNLDEEIAQARFGTPAETIQLNEQQKNLLYPEKGLDLILNADGKDVLQYLSPGEFSQHRTQLQQLSAAGE